MCNSQARPLATILSSKAPITLKIFNMFYLLGAVAVFILGVSIYRLYFHPLARYPGPIRYKLSGLPLVWQAYRGNRHLFHIRDHEKYGK